MDHDKFFNEVANWVEYKGQLKTKQQIMIATTLLSLLISFLLLAMGGHRAWNGELGIAVLYFILYGIFLSIAGVLSLMANNYKRVFYLNKMLELIPEKKESEI